MDIKAVLAKQIAMFIERDWEQFHSPKNIAMNLACEVGELLEPFRWLTEEQSAHLDEKTLADVREELADVFNMLTYLAHKLNIDLIEAADKKLDVMARKYPAHLCRGKSQKYTAYENTTS